jgi:NADH-quinone oxidoreductase subunit F
MKWSFTRPLDVPQKYVICNLDEREPGTIKDRYIVEGDPHELLKGMAIAGFAVGANEGFIYSRGEYYLCKHRLNTAIAHARAKGMLGKNLFSTNFSFDVEVRSGFGCYIWARKPRSLSPSKENGATPALSRPSPGWRACGRNPPLSTMWRPLHRCRPSSPRVGSGTNH